MQLVSDLFTTTHETVPNHIQPCNSTAQDLAPQNTADQKGERQIPEDACAIINAQRWVHHDSHSDIEDYPMVPLPILHENLA
jgi:hypothetical protein